MARARRDCRNPMKFAQCESALYWVIAANNSSQLTSSVSIKVWCFFLIWPLGRYDSRKPAISYKHPSHKGQTTRSYIVFSISSSCHQQIDTLTNLIVIGAFYPKKTSHSISNRFRCGFLHFIQIESRCHKVSSVHLTRRWWNANIWKTIFFWARDKAIWPLLIAFWRWLILRADS